MSKITNGVNVTDLMQTIDAVKANPTMAKFNFRLENKWIEGSRNRSLVNGFHGAGQEIQRPQAFLLQADEPAILLGSDQAPNPAEYMLQALAACVTTSIVYHAAARGIEIQEVESQVEGDVDVRGFLGLDKSVRAGFQNIRMTLAIRADVSDEELETIAGFGPGFSPVFDSIAQGVGITLHAERMAAEKVTSAA